MKRLLYLTFAITLLLSLNGCSSDSGGSVTPIDTNDTNDTNITFPDAVMHDANFTSIHFSGAGNCARCHDNIEDNTTKDVSLVKAWQGTMMANAAIDPLYRAKVASEVKRNPDYRAVIEAKCSRCHMPMAHVEVGFAGETPAMSGDGFTNPDSPHYDAAMHGISCTLCHQIENNETLGTEEGFSGNFIVAENFGDDRKIYGPYEAGLNPNPMKNNVDFTPVYSAHVEESKLCATCHNLNTPVIDTDHHLTDPIEYFPEQAVYTEWEYSDFNATQSCQDCHMPKTEGSVVISKNPVGNPERFPFHQHQFVGANTFMLEIIKNNRIKLGAIGDEASFDARITDTKEFLKAAADVNVSTPVLVDNSTLHFSVIVTNRSGHKFPTSLPVRRAWLHVKVTNDANKTVFESGALNSAGQIIGVDDTPDYERHHETIDDTSSVQVYGTIMADTDDNLTYTFMHASQYLRDNRILPKGFKRDIAPYSTQPYGLATADADYQTGGSDTVAYVVSGMADGNYTVTATLNYQTPSYGFTQDLYQDDDLPEVALMKALDANTTNRFEMISTDTKSTTP